MVIYLITEKKALFSTCTKVKEFPSDCGNYRGLKLTDQVLKVEERVLETKCVIILNIVCIDEMQFGSVFGMGTTDAIFIVRQLQEKYISVKNPLFFAFVDLEKAFDRAPRKVLWWALKSLGSSNYPSHVC